ncbi:MAG: DUF1273 domain-containing protein [Clostridiales bacterium]|nr:DUF1273 domain-containing protein [Clostridiales bacterium]
MTPRKACCFTGHRELPKEGTPAYFQLRLALLHAVRDAIAEGFTVFLNGGASGFDLLAAETVLECRALDPLVELRVIVPYAGQADRYAFADKKRYRRILDEAAQVHVLSEKYFSGCMRARNERLVCHADRCIAYLRKPSGGTLMTVNMAVKKGIEVIYL